MTNVKNVKESCEAIASFESNRSTGRTFRCVLSAVLRCSSISPRDKRTIFVIGANEGVCRCMHAIAIKILTTIGGCTSERDEIVLPNGSRLLFRAYHWYEKQIEISGKRGEIVGYPLNENNVFVDHFTGINHG